MNKYGFQMFKIIMEENLTLGAQTRDFCMAVVPDAHDAGKSSYSYYYKEEHEKAKKDKE